jgi:hypothetical protein
VPVELLWRRLGVDKEALKGPQGESELPRATHGLEQRLIQLLLDAEVAAPPVEELPPPAALFDAACRNIYAVFCALYQEGRAKPDARSVRDALGDGGNAVDQLARILLEGSVASREGELPGALAQIRRRWQQQRLRELAAELEQAQRVGDSARMDRILEEKTALSARMHRGRSD